MASASIGLSLGLTYALHAGAWALLAALAARSKHLSDAARHGCWKAALFGPLLSASLAIAWPSAAGADASVHEASRASTLELSLRSVERSERAWGGFVAAAGALGLLRFAGSLLVLRRRLRTRAPVSEPRFVRRFEKLCQRMALRGVRLTECEGITSPLLVGRREVVVPHAALRGLSDDEWDAALAHELAHLERGDGLWFPLAGAVQHALWFQPLNHWVAARFRSSAELSCDDRAVELTQNPLALGRAIVHLAEASRSSSAEWVPAMARRGSELVGRVRRLTRVWVHASARRGTRRGLVAVTLLAAALVALDVRVVRAREEARVDVAAESARLAQLALRDRQIASSLAELLLDSEAAHAGSPEAVRLLELEQELRHVRATQTWLEQGVVAALRTEPSR